MFHSQNVGQNSRYMRILYPLRVLILSILLHGCANDPELSVHEAESVAIKRVLNEVNLSGSGYELGLQHGEKLKPEINEIVKKWKKNAAEQSGKEAGELIKEFLDYADFKDAIMRYTPDLYEEIKGIADGANLSLDEILVLNLRYKFWVYMMQTQMHHCSNLVVPSTDGSTSFIAQNMDIENYTDGFQTLLRIRRTEATPEQLIFTHPGLIALNGMNETGVGVVVNTLMALNACNDGLPVAFVVRRLIRSTEKDDILDFIQTVKHASGQNYIIGIRGEVYDFEASSNKVVQFDPKNKNGSVYHTNHPIANKDLKNFLKSLSGR
jgi:predicted choloylglycine hydrolase